MGRWSQQSRRGGGGGAPGSITPNVVNLVSVQADGTDWILHFDGPVAMGAGNDDSAFFVGDATLFHADSVAGSAASGVDDGTGGYVPGLAWSLTSQPAWLATAVNFPAGGVTT
jgi:hypothetical protein